jgi:hypothetical protein
MSRRNRFPRAVVILSSFALLILSTAFAASGQSSDSQIGREVAIPQHLKDGDEFHTPLQQLLSYGLQLFEAKFTIQDGAGRPLTKGTGAPLSDPSSPLVFPDNFDRLSGPDSSSCAGCHNGPFVGGGGDRATEVFVLGQRFDRITFDHSDGIVTRGAVDESGKFITMSTTFDERKTIGMNGSGFIEMLARQMTADLQAIRNATPPGMSRALVSKGISFGTIRHNADGTWDTSQVQGVCPLSLVSTGANNPPTLAISPFAQGSNVISIRQFTNNATNQHHGMQPEERFGLNADPDGDSVVNELTAADITALSLFQATMAVPGQVIPDDPAAARAAFEGREVFDRSRCNSCHVDALPLTNKGWIYSEPSPYNPVGNLQLGPENYPLTAPALSVDLTSNELPQPRLHAIGNVLMVPAYTDLKLHDISATSNPATDPECEPLDQNQVAGTDAFFAGNCKFITRKLWGFYNQGGAFMHHGKFTTAREAAEAHNGEALIERQAFDALPAEQQNDLIEFLKSLQVLPPGSRSLVVDQYGRPLPWPPVSTSSLR